jgi:hypothetical protein
VATRDRDAVQLRAVVPLVVAATKQLVGPAMIVANNAKAIAVAGSELLRPHNPKDLALAMSLDGSLLVPVANWGLGRYSGVGLVELGAAIPASTPDLTPLPINSVNASVDTRGAPSALVTITAKEGGGYQRELIPVYVDNVDGGGGGIGDDYTRLASPIEALDVGRLVAGAILFSWFPSDPVLGRKPEVLAVGIAYPYTLTALRPRDLPAFAEILGLDDLGRALLSKSEEPAERPELAQVTGEIAESKS